MTANNICCYSNEANDRDVVIEFHASRLDGGHWADLLGQRQKDQVRWAHWSGMKHPSGSERDGRTAETARRESIF